MKPLEIRLHLITPVAQAPVKKGFPLHLDALLISVLAKQEKKVYPLDPSENFNDPFSPEKKALPIAVAGKQKPVYCASAAFCLENETDLYSYVRKPPEIEVWAMTSHKEFRQGGEGSGKKKAVLETLTVIQPRTLIFQCIGDKLGLHDILKEVKHIGYKRNAGFGEVYDFEILEIENKYAGLVTYDRKPARALPVIDWPEQTGWLKLRMAYKAPYWEPKNIDICWSPDFSKTYPRIG